MSDQFDLIHSSKAEWDSLQPLSPENEQRLWKKLRLEWNYHSNHIEGNTLTYGETELLLLHNQTHGNHSLREYEEMKAHDVGILHLQTLAADASRLIGEGDIRDLNKIILKEPFWKPAQTADGKPARKQIIPGEYKTTPNNVLTATGEVFEFAPPSEVASRMQTLVSWLAGSLESGDLHILQIAAKLHHDFVLIHPFDDGNGRVARMLVNYLFMRYGYPPIIVPTDRKKDYLTALRLADAGDLAPLAEFIGKQLERSLDLAIRAGKGESIDEPSDVEKQVALYIREQKVRTNTDAVPKEIIEALMRSSIAPFIEKLETKMRTLAPLFSRMDLLAIDGNGELASGWGFLFHSNFEVVGPRRKFIITFIYNSYQEPAPSPFDFQTIVEFEFSHEEYKIIQDGKVIVARPYSTLLLAEEIDQITAEILGNAFKEIRNKASTAR